MHSKFLSFNFICSSESDIINGKKCLERYVSLVISRCTKISILYAIMQKKCILHTVVIISHFLVPINAAKQLARFGNLIIIWYKDSDSELRYLKRWVYIVYFRQRDSCFMLNMVQKSLARQYSQCSSE
jgi:hypothetical protein